MDGVSVVGPLRHPVLCTRNMYVRLWVTSSLHRVHEEGEVRCWCAAVVLVVGG